MCCSLGFWYQQDNSELLFVALALPAGFPLPRYRQNLGFAPFLGRAQQHAWRNLTLNISVTPIIPVPPKIWGVSSFNVTSSQRGFVCVTAVSEEQANVSPWWGVCAKF